MLLRLVSEYDLIVIPLYNVQQTPNKNSDSNIELWPRISNFQKRQKRFRLDIGPYDEATEMVDIDNFDYNNDRTDVLNTSKENDLGLGKEEISARFGQDRIVGGFEVDINLYPYHAAYGTNCGGAIIDKKWVITAGHCGYVFV